MRRSMSKYVACKFDVCKEQHNMYVIIVPNRQYKEIRYEMTKIHKNTKFKRKCKTMMKLQFKCKKN